MDKKQEVISILSKQGILIPADQEAKIQELAGQVAPQTASQLGLATDVDKAYYILTKNNAGSAVSTSNVSVSISKTEQLNYQRNLAKNGADLAANTQGTVITKLILDKPEPSTYIAAGTTGLIDEKSFNALKEKIDNGTYKIVEDYTDDDGNEIKSQANYDALAAAFAGKTPVAVYMPKLSSRPIGYEVIKRGSKTAEKFTRDDMQRYLVFHTQGYLAKQDKMPSVKLRTVASKNKTNVPGEVQKAHATIADVDRTKAIENGAWEPSSQATNKTKEAGLRSELFVKVNNTAKKRVTEKGTFDYIMTVRVKVVAEVKELERKADMVDKFGQMKKSGAGNKGMSKKSMEAIADAKRLAAEQMYDDIHDPEKIGELVDIEEEVRALFAGTASDDRQF